MDLLHIFMFQTKPKLLNRGIRNRYQNKENEAKPLKHVSEERNQYVFVEKLAL